METTVETRACQECGKQLRGRQDQKYCTDQCRTSANNRIAKAHLDASSDDRRTVNHILRNNHRILYALKQRGLEFSRMYVRDLGFSFRYLTAMEEKEEGRVNYCYDFGYIVQEDVVRLL